MKDVEQLWTQLQNQSEGGDVTGAHQTAELILDSCKDAVDLVKAGKYLENLGAQSDARRAFERAIALTPDFALAHSALGLLSLDEGDIEHAVSHFREAVRLEPRDVGKLTLLGVACCDAGMEEEGRNSLMRALEIDPDNDEVNYNLGFMLRNTDPAQARICFSRALESYTEYALAHRELGWLLAKQSPGPSRRHVKFR
jgi:Flp pilus assembly protein TadD